MLNKQDIKVRQHTSSPIFVDPLGNSTDSSSAFSVLSSSSRRFIPVFSFSSSFSSDVLPPMITLRLLKTEATEEDNLPIIEDGWLMLLDEVLVTSSTVVGLRGSRGEVLVVPRGDDSMEEEVLLPRTDVGWLLLLDGLLVTLSAVVGKSDSRGEVLVVAAANVKRCWLLVELLFIFLFFSQPLLYTLFLKASKAPYNFDAR
jgi:hypothetical protein